MQILTMDISAKSELLPILAKQGDVGRKFQAVITDNGEAYEIPEGALLSAWFSGTSGEGNYSEIGENSAFEVEGNTVVVELISQMLVNKGGGTLCLILNNQDGTQIGLWDIPYLVEAVPGMDSAGTEQYFTALSEAAAKVAASAAAFETDATLTKEGKAADAKAAGDALAKKVPVSRTVNGKALTGNITLRAADVNAAEAVESPDYPGCYYRTVGGATEWINPPMILETEYRTTERWLGSPVYVKVVDLGEIPESGSAKRVSFSDAAVSQVVSLSVLAYNAAGAFAHGAYAATSYRTFIENNKTVVITNDAGTTGYSAYAVVKYTL